MYGKLLLNFILITSLAAMQVSFIGALPGFLGGLNIILVISLYRLGFYGLEHTLWWALVSAALIDFFSFLPFGANVFALLISVVLCHFLLANSFTNRSLYSFLALGFFATICFESIIRLYVKIASFFTGDNSTLFLSDFFWRQELNILAVNLFFVFLLFNIYGSFTSKLKSAFLLR